MLPSAPSAKCVLLGRLRRLRAFARSRFQRTLAIAPPIASRRASAALQAERSKLDHAFLLTCKRTGGNFVQPESAQVRFLSEPGNVAGTGTTC